MKRFVILLPLLAACAPAAECAVKRPSLDPKVETVIWEPAACPARVVRPAVNDRDGGGLAMPVASIPDPVKPEPETEEPTPDPKPDPKLDPKPGQEPGKGGKAITDGGTDAPRY